MKQFSSRGIRILEDDVSSLGSSHYSNAYNKACSSSISTPLVQIASYKIGHSTGGTTTSSVVDGKHIYSVVVHDYADVDSLASGSEGVSYDAYGDHYKGLLVDTVPRARRTYRFHGKREKNRVFAPDDNAGKQALFGSPYRRQRTTLGAPTKGSKVPITGANKSIGKPIFLRRPNGRPPIAKDDALDHLCNSVEQVTVRTGPRQTSDSNGVINRRQQDFQHEVLTHASGNRAYFMQTSDSNEVINRRPQERQQEVLTHASGNRAYSMQTSDPNEVINRRQQERQQEALTQASGIRAYSIDKVTNKIEKQDGDIDWNPINIRKRSNRAGIHNSAPTQTTKLHKKINAPTNKAAAPWRGKDPITATAVPDSRGRQSRCERSKETRQPAPSTWSADILDATFDGLEEATCRSPDEDPQQFSPGKDILDVVFEGVEVATCDPDNQNFSRQARSDIKCDFEQATCRSPDEDPQQFSPGKDILDVVFEGVEVATCGPDDQNFSRRARSDIKCDFEQPTCRSPVRGPQQSSPGKDFLDVVFEGVEVATCRPDDRNFSRRARSDIECDSSRAKSKAEKSQTYLAQKTWLTQDIQQRDGVDMFDSFCNGIEYYVCRDQGVGLRTRQKPDFLDFICEPYAQVGSKNRDGITSVYDADRENSILESVGSIISSVASNAEAKRTLVAADTPRKPRGDMLDYVFENVESRLCQPIHDELSLSSFNPTGEREYQVLHAPSDEGICVEAPL